VGTATLRWMKEETTPKGRILFETSKAWIYDDAEMAGYLAHHSNRELIGGPSPKKFFAGFWDGWIFGKPIAKIPVDQFRDYLRRYNIGWIVAHSHETKGYLANIPGVSRTATAGPVTYYAVDQPLSFILEGDAASVRRDNRRLFVRFAGSHGGDAILKYHYAPSLKAHNAQLSPARVGDDPQPFIRVRSAETEVVIGD